jgi:uncharacterized protein YggE
MKKRLLLVLGLVPVTLAVLAAGCGTLTPPPAVSQAASGSAGQNTGIWVTGEGKATAVPDVAIMNAIVGELKSAGVADKDIQTQQYYITPVWTTNKDTGQQTLAGYRVTNTVTAKIRTVAKTGDIINAVVSAGGNYTTINSISFTVDNPSPYQKTARQAAMTDAQARAKTLADAAGVKLGAPTYISESGNFLPIVNVPVPSAGAPAPSPPPISPGEATITVDVQVVYSIK